MRGNVFSELGNPSVEKHCARCGRAARTPSASGSPQPGRFRLLLFFAGDTASFHAHVRRDEAPAVSVMARLGGEARATRFAEVFEHEPIPAQPADQIFPAMQIFGRSPFA